MNTFMTITFLQAYNGDGIHIEHDGHHVIIDGGPKCEELELLVGEIVANHEIIDLLIITHYDEDHILGIYKILSKLSSTVSLKNMIGEVWFNATKIGAKGNPYMLSANQALKMGKLLIRNDVNWISEVQTGKQFNIGNDGWLEVIYGGEIFEINAENTNLSSVYCDWKSTFQVLEPFVDDKIKDVSPVNAQSMILVLHIGKDKQVLLTGDATPDKLFAALGEYLEKGNSNCFELIKLPHHGSYRNLTKDILEQVVCFDYVICSNGDRYYLPDKKALMKIFKWGRKKATEKIRIHLNYYTDLFPKLNISEQDMQNNHFFCDGKRIFECRF